MSVGNCLPTYMSYYLRNFESSLTLLLERQLSLTIFYFSVVLLLSSHGNSISAGNLVSRSIVLILNRPKYSFPTCVLVRFSILREYIYIYVCVCVCVYLYICMCVCVGGPCVSIVLYFMVYIFHPVHLFIGDIKGYVRCP